MLLCVVEKEAVEKEPIKDVSLKKLHGGLPVEVRFGGEVGLKGVHVGGKVVENRGV